MASQFAATFFPINQRPSRCERRILSPNAPVGSRRTFIRHHVTASKGFGQGSGRKKVQQSSNAPNVGVVKSRKAKTSEDLASQVSSGLQGTNLYMVGMMGSGKSKIGKILADVLQYAFFDTDDLVEAASGVSVAEVFATVGKDEFRKLETQVLRELHCYKNCVVSTGGGIVIERENWSYMQQGIVVWLSGSSKLLAKRLTHTGVESRPLLADCEDVNGVVEKLDGILLERGDFYKNADIVVPLDTPEGTPPLSPSLVVKSILERLDSRMREAILEREAKKDFEIIDEGPIHAGNAAESSSTPFWKRLGKLRGKEDSANNQFDPEE